MSRDPIREYLTYEARQRRRRIGYAVAGWGVVILAVLFMLWLLTTAWMVVAA